MKGVIDVAVRRLSKCPRCGGNMFLDRDPSGWYEECLQCSSWRKVESMGRSEELPSQMVKESQSGSLLPGCQSPGLKINL